MQLTGMIQAGGVGRIKHMIDGRAVLEPAARHRLAAARAQARELAELAAYATATAGEEFAYLEVAALLHLSDREAQDRLEFAVTLTHHLPQTLAAFTEGRLTEYRARVITEAVANLDPQVAAAVEARVLPRAGEQTVSELRRALRRAVIAADPAGAEQRRRVKVRDRQVYSYPTEDGQAALTIYHSVEVIAAMHSTIATHARHLKNLGGEARTVAQIEADVAADLILGTDPDRRVIEMHVTLPASGPAEIDGLGPITREHALELAGQAKRWRWIKTDPAGRVVDLTTAAYSPPKVLAELVKVRDRTCRHPGCLRPARRCDIDHLTPWPTGKTCDGNCVCLCRRHHRAKHEGGWQVEQITPGVFRWITPLGFEHVVEPDPVTDPDPPPF
ncbi:MAG TPA: DUF222 domain-containing protein [Micromonosporaceae bacterium]|nr:DUF222 domain-containing protein [Micromonosporaceae bacterium]